MGELPKARPNLGAYYAASRKRMDAWQLLKSRSKRPGAEAEVRALLDTLEPIERCFAYPGVHTVVRLRGMLDRGDLGPLGRLAEFVTRMLVSHAYRWYADEDETSSWPEPSGGEELPPHPGLTRDDRPYFEVLVVDDIPGVEEDLLREQLRGYRGETDEFVYDVVVVPSFEDALIAVLLNFHIQSVVIRFGFPVAAASELPLAQRLVRTAPDLADLDDTEIGLVLGDAVAALRPELDLFLVTDAPVEDLAGRTSKRFRRVFFRQEDYRELHLSILKGVRARYATPFFNALRAYSQRPTGVFHALPVARGKSIARSHWLRDMEQFYGSNVFLAETSATTAGLDSLLQPHGSLKLAQSAAARAYGAKRTFFVTNGTSTANKIVLQALIRPGDIALVSRDCHQSHHYALMLCGGEPVYLDPYPLPQYAMYGAVPLADIKRELLALRARGLLHRVSVLLLTSCTFDGLVYHPERVMSEVLAIHPDITFVWDEAWFAFAAFTPVTRRRTAMSAATRIRERLRDPAFRARHAEWKRAFDANPDPAKWEGELLPDPARAKVRVYATQSTHKTLTSLRQGSMIHVHDEVFDERASEAFHQAYLTHTSTSANYQILASLDLGRRQVELEGYEMVQHAIELALMLRDRINGDERLSRYFRILTVADLIPPGFRPSGFATYRQLDTDWESLERAWSGDELCLDPTRLTLFIGHAGAAGDAFKSRLIEEFDIQVNKTSRNTVLFMTHIGTTRGAAAYLVDVLCKLADELDDAIAAEGPARRKVREETVRALVERCPPLPRFSSFYPVFQGTHGSTGREGDLRSAFFLATDERNVFHLRLDGSVQAALSAGSVLVSGAFVTPYPPGFPILVPGQVIDADILACLRAVDVKEIHGYDPDLGLRLLTAEALRRHAAARRIPSPEPTEPEE